MCTGEFTTTSANREVSETKNTQKVGCSWAKPLRLSGRLFNSQASKSDKTPLVSKRRHLFTFTFQHTIMLKSIIVFFYATPVLVYEGAAKTLDLTPGDIIATQEELDNIIAANAAEIAYLILEGLVLAD